MLPGPIRRHLGPANLWRLKLLRKTFEFATTTTPLTKTCNICGYSGYFLPVGSPIRSEAECPNCFSVERHRNLKLWFDHNSELFRAKSVLHFAPEPCVTHFIKPAALRYVTADLEPGRYDLTLNIEKIDLPDGQFDIVICSHVLEHVDDRAALSELHRIITVDGFLIVMVPLIEGWDATYEDNTLRSEVDRTLYFGQRDHVRLYGADIRKRITEAGFILDEFTAVEPYVAKHGLLRGDKVFVAQRSRNGP